MPALFQLHATRSRHPRLAGHAAFRRRELTVTVQASGDERRAVKRTILPSAP